MPTRLVVFLLLSSVLLASCSSSIVLTNNRKPYDIYVNNQLKGSGTARIARSGFPQSATVQVRDAAGNVLVQEKIKRELNLVKFIAGFFYLYPLWFLAWDYDKEIKIFVPNQENKEWDNEPHKGKWD